MQIKSTALVGALCMAATTHSVASATTSWDWRLDAPGTLTHSHTYSSTTGSPTASLTISAWSNTRDVGGPDTIETARLAAYSGGIGITNNDDGSHTIDGDRTSSDSFENMDALLLHFDRDVTLADIKIGYIQSGYDADISILAWNGAGTGPSSLTGQSYTSLESGWDLLGHFYHNSGTGSLADTNSDTTNSGGLAVYDFDTIASPGDVLTTTSSYYLISVLNPELNSGSCSSQSRYCSPTADAPNERFKVWSVAAKQTSPSTTPGVSVPAPSSLFLLLAGIPLILRRQKSGRSDT